MAIQQPQTDDKLNSPDHAKLHRVLGIDTNASDESVVIDDSGNVGIGTTTVGARVDIQGAGGDILRLADSSGTNKVTVLNNGNVGIGTTSPDTKLHNVGAYTQEPLSADPADPDAGHSVQWVSDGTGSGDAGDVMIKINVEGTTKTITLVDYSAN